MISQGSRLGFAHAHPMVGQHQPDDEASDEEVSLRRYAKNAKDALTTTHTYTHSHKNSIVPWPFYGPHGRDPQKLSSAHACPATRSTQARRGKGGARGPLKGTQGVGRAAPQVPTGVVMKFPVCGVEVECL